MAHKTPTKRVVDVRLTVLDGGSIPPISTAKGAHHWAPLSCSLRGYLFRIKTEPIRGAAFRRSESEGVSLLQVSFRPLVSNL
jgi:hypothetical protein